MPSNKYCVNRLLGEPVSRGSRRQPVRAKEAAVLHLLSFCFLLALYFAFDMSGVYLFFVLLIGVLAGLELILFTALPEAMEARKPTRAVRS